jgi:hypothetical protein
VVVTRGPGSSPTPARTMNTASSTPSTEKAAFIVVMRCIDSFEEPGGSGTPPTPRSTASTSSTRMVTPVLRSIGGDESAACRQRRQRQSKGDRAAQGWLRVPRLRPRAPETPGMIVRTSGKRTRGRSWAGTRTEVGRSRRGFLRGRNRGGMQATDRLVSDSRELLTKVHLSRLEMSPLVGATAVVGGAPRRLSFTWSDAVVVCRPRPAGARPSRSTLRGICTARAHCTSMAVKASSKPCV